MSLKNRSTILLLLLLLATAFLRFAKLGYSDYLKDEHRTFYDFRYQGTFWEFALDQRKGPMQYLVAFIPKFFVGDFSNEFAQRFGFALLNTTSVYVFYLLIRKMTEDQRIALTAAALYSVNGFVTAFGRIAQYQSLNLFFSLMALFFYYELAFSSSKTLRNALLGTLCLVISSLSHWDVIFIVVPVLYFWLYFLLKQRVSQRLKLAALGVSLGGFLLLVLPFLIPYINNQAVSAGNRSYLNRRVGFNRERDLEFDFLIKLYNPFLAYYLYVILGLLGALVLRKSWLLVVWFGVDYLLFYLFAAKPGTHVYNFLLPVFGLCGIGFWFVYDKLGQLRGKLAKVGSLMLVFLLITVVCFLYFQSYRLFVESRDEYPWEDERILFLTAAKYQDKKVLPLFGFPHYRGWDQIGEFIARENAAAGMTYTYDTNEDNSNISYYTGVDKSRSSTGYFYIGVKRPISFVQDWKPKQIRNKTTVKTIIVDGETVAIVYQVAPKVELPSDR
ncbi:MAG: phospholipid carrier-dependent glycosyltransferase [bacterium]